MHLKKEYDKQTKDDYQRRESYKNWGWQFKIDIPEDFLGHSYKRAIVRSVMI